MKVAEIRKALKENPNEVFAVSVPRDPSITRLGRAVVKADIEEVAGRHVYVAVADEFRLQEDESLYSCPKKVNRTYLNVSTGSVLGPWGSYVLNRDWEQALAMDKRRTERLQYEAERKERTDHIRAWSHAFDGIMVPADSLSSANFERPDEDLGDYIRETFADEGASGTMFGPAVFEAIAERMEAMSVALIEAGSGFVPDGRTDDGQPEITQLRPKRTLDEIREALEKA